MARLKPGRVSVCCDDYWGGEAAAVLGAHAHDAAAARIDDRLDYVAALVQRGPRCYGMSSKQLIKVSARPNQAVARKVGKIGPLQLERSLAAVDSQALVVQPAGFFGGVDAQPDQLARATRGEAVTADFLPRERALLQQGDAQAMASQVGCRRRAGRAGANHDHVSVDSRRARDDRVRQVPRTGRAHSW